MLAFAWLAVEDDVFVGGGEQRKEVQPEGEAVGRAGESVGRVWDIGMQSRATRSSAAGPSASGSGKGSSGLMGEHVVGAQVATGNLLDWFVNKFSIQVHLLPLRVLTVPLAARRGNRLPSLAHGLLLPSPAGGEASATNRLFSPASSPLPSFTPSLNPLRRARAPQCPPPTEAPPASTKFFDSSCPRRPAALCGVDIHPSLAGFVSTEMSEFLELEAQDGIRMTWNVIPGTKQDATNCVVPVSAIYTPLKPNPSIPVLPYGPLRCRICRSILNPFSIVDFAAKIWVCPFCFQRNHFPQHYSSISENNLPAELFPQYTTVEYLSTTEAGPVPPPVFLFVVDTCMIEEEIGYLKSALAQAIELLPDKSLVGFITFGTYVQVHELGFSLLPKSYVFKGMKEVTKDQILEQMCFFSGKAKPTTGVIAGSRDGLSAESIARFLLPASECEFVLNSIIEELQKDPWPVPADQRASRCTGAALSVAASLLGVCVPGSGARIMAFIGGPSTEGPGSIVSKSLSEPIRSHKDLEKDSAPLYSKAVKFYEELSKQLVHQGHVGVAEMKVAVERTGGLVVLAESFGHSWYFEINCSKDIKIQGIIGPCTSLEKELIAGFDQEAAAAVMARLVSFKMEAEADFDPIRWLDRALISLCSKFGDYQKETPSSFSLSPRMSIFPQFIFNLRRSQFVQVFNNSPDETAYFSMMLNRENVANSVVMIQPSLISYSFQSDPEPVLLDATAISADRILLLDSYFTVVIFHGITVAQWRKAGYQDQEGHEAFAQLLQAPREEADTIMKERFPVPRLVVCDQYGSQARFLLAKLNPSVTHNSDNAPPPGVDLIFTDDVSFEVFMDHLQRLAVQ
ncbi:hypothetical protein EJB05_48716, partial [Eragrostis curvula]